jgi:hypothetical protein
LLSENPPPKKCAGLATHVDATAIVEKDGECLVVCDRGEFGYHAAVYKPTDTNVREGTCVDFGDDQWVPRSFVELDGETLAFGDPHPLPSFDCGGVVGRVRHSGRRWRIEEIGPLPAAAQSYSREENAIIVELACPGWYGIDMPAGDWHRSRARITTKGIELLVDRARCCPE